MYADRTVPMRRDDTAAHQIRIVTIDNTRRLAVGCTCTTVTVALVHDSTGWGDLWAPWIEWHAQHGIVVERGVTYYDDAT